MPTNLPPEYHHVETQYKAAESESEKIRLLEELISTVPKHKGTDKLRADLRRRLSKLKNAAQSKKSGSKHESAFHVDKEGAGQVAVVGHANTGKSLLVSSLTHADPDVEEYPFSTWVPTPGMMSTGGIQIELIDTPPLNRDYVEHELIDLIRRSDLILVLVDVLAFPIKQLEETVQFLEEHRIIAAHRKHETEDQIRNTFVPFIVGVTKVDDESAMEEFSVFEELFGDEWDLLPISLSTRKNLDSLQNSIIQTLGLMRVYSKPPGKPPDMTAPFVLKIGSTVDDFAVQVHRDIMENLKTARVWGTGVFDGQQVSRDHILHEGDIVELKT